MSLYFQEGMDLKQKKQLSNNKVGTKVKTVRKSLNMTQKQFSDEYNIRGGHSAVSKIENAKRSITADLLPILAEDGNIMVEQFYREDVTVVKGVFYDCLSRMDIDSEHIEPMVKYVNQLTDDAIKNVGPTKLFDLLFTVVRMASQNKTSNGYLKDELNVIDLDDYKEKKSRYINYLKEMSIYSKRNE